MPDSQSVVANLEIGGISDADVAAKISKSTLNANTLLGATSDDTPIALTISQALDLASGTSANGDILLRSGGAWVKLAKGTDGQVLTMVSGAPAWATP